MMEAPLRRASEGAGVGAIPRSNSLLFWCVWGDAQRLMLDLHEATRGRTRTRLGPPSPRPHTRSAGAAGRVNHKYNSQAARSFEPGPGGKALTWELVTLHLVCPGVSLRCRVLYCRCSFATTAATRSVLERQWLSIRALHTEVPDSTSRIWPGQLPITTLCSPVARDWATVALRTASRCHPSACLTLGHSSTLSRPPSRLRRSSRQGQPPALLDRPRPARCGWGAHFSIRLA